MCHSSTEKFQQEVYDLTGVPSISEEAQEVDEGGSDADSSKAVGGHTEKQEQDTEEGP